MGDEAPFPNLTRAILLLARARLPGVTWAAEARWQPGGVAMVRLYRPWGEHDPDTGRWAVTGDMGYTVLMADDQAPDGYGEWVEHLATIIVGQVADQLATTN